MADTIVSGAISVCKVLHTCKLCGKGFYPKKTDRTQFCGRECGIRWSAFKTAVRHHGGRVWVRVLRQKPRPKADPHPWRWPTVARTCASCGVEFTTNRTGGRFPTCCSGECKASLKRAARSIAKRKRQRAINCQVRVDTIDPLKVFERDAWRCQICGRKTPQSKRGTYQPTAPELDHIVALANGGTHTWDNVQCACRSCNGRKGASDFGQLHLFPAE